MPVISTDIPSVSIIKYMDLLDIRVYCDIISLNKLPLMYKNVKLSVSGV